MCKVSKRKEAKSMVQFAFWGKMFKSNGGQKGCIYLKSTHLSFGCAGSSLLCAGFLSLRRAGTALNRRHGLLVEVASRGSVA